MMLAFYITFDNSLNDVKAFTYAFVIQYVEVTYIVFCWCIYCRLSFHREELRRTHVGELERLEESFRTRLKAAEEQSSKVRSQNTNKTLLN